MTVKSSLLAVSLGIILAGCSSVPATPPPAANSPNQPAATSSSFAAHNDLNITVAAMLSSNASADYQVGPQDLLEIPIFNIPETMTWERGDAPNEHGPGKPTGTNITAADRRGGRQGIDGSIGLEKKLRAAYDNYIYNPQVGVLIREYRQRVSVIGAVSKTRRARPHRARSP